MHSDLLKGGVNKEVKIVKRHPLTGDHREITPNTNKELPYSNSIIDSGESVKQNLSTVNDVDSEGNALTEEQQEYFKDSKVRDDNGNLLVMFHGTDKDFTVFNQGTAQGWGKGIYFTNDIGSTDEYGDVKVKAYLNITNPFDTRTMSPSDIETKAYETDACKAFDRRNYERNEQDNYDSYEDYHADISVSLDTIYDEYVNVFNGILRELGYDGIISDHSNNIEGLEVVAFSPEQIKRVDNENPTANPDIRYSYVNDYDEDIDSGGMLQHSMEQTIQRMKNSEEARFAEMRKQYNEQKKEMDRQYRQQMQGMEKELATDRKIMTDEFLRLLRMYEKQGKQSEDRKSCMTITILSNPKQSDCTAAVCIV